MISDIKRILIEKQQSELDELSNKLEKMEEERKKNKVKKNSRQKVANLIWII